MKKLVFFIGILLTSVSCNQLSESSDFPRKDYTVQIQTLNKIYAEGLYIAANSFRSNINKTGKNSVSINQPTIIRNTLVAFEGNYFTAIDKSYLSIADDFNTLHLPTNSLPNARQQSFSIDQYERFNAKQKEIAQQFVDKLLAVNDPLSAKNLAIDFQSKVALQAFTDDEKLELFSLGSAAIAFSDFIANGGTDIIYKALVDELNNTSNTSPNGRVKGCSVNWRSVWAGAVIGFVVGGVGGAKVGCAGGMVAGPIGAASGCVGGAVMGGASGFIGGAATSVAGELLTSCFR